MKIFQTLLFILMTLVFGFIQAEPLTDEQQKILDKITVETAIDDALEHPDLATAILNKFPENKELKKDIETERKRRKIICSHVYDDSPLAKDLKTGCQPEEDNDNPATTNPEQNERDGGKPPSFS